MDGIARQELLAINAPRDRIVVAGQPFLEKRAREIKSGVIKKNLDKRLQVMFLSQPLHILPEAKQIGYDEFMVLGCVSEALNKISTEGGKRPRLIIRLHPREKKTHFLNYMRSLKTDFEWEFDLDKSPDKTIMSSHFIVGISSMLLIEASLAGKRVISVQPRLKSEDQFMFSRMKYCPLARCPKDLIIFLSGGAVRKHDLKLDKFIRNNQGSCNRILDLAIAL
jgi:UDP-N-acetylglucosamine 2-epimerase